MFLGLCPVLSGSTNVAKRLDVIVYPGSIRRVTGHARAECATSIRFQLITARTWCVGRAASAPASSLNPSYNLRSNCEKPIHLPDVNFTLDQMTTFGEARCLCRNKKLRLLSFSYPIYLELKKVGKYKMYKVLYCLLTYIPWRQIKRKYRILCDLF